MKYINLRVASVVSQTIEEERDVLANDFAGHKLWNYANLSPLFERVPSLDLQEDLRTVTVHYGQFRPSKRTGRVEGSQSLFHFTFPKAGETNKFLKLHIIVELGAFLILLLLMG